MPYALTSERAAKELADTRNILIGRIALVDEHKA